MKKQCLRILFSLFCIIIAWLFQWNYLFYLLSYIVISYDVIWNAFRNLFKGKIFDEHFLMTIATFGAIYIGEFSEAVMVMILYQIGELFQDCAVSKSRKSIASLMNIRPDYANVDREGKIIQVDPNIVEIGDSILIKPGEKIPLDGTVIEGESLLNTIALTGESIPRKVQIGDTVLSGCINGSGLLKIKVTKKFGESTVSKILDLVENVSTRKSTSENFIQKFAKYYTPIVVFIAGLLALLPPLLITGASFHDWLYRSLSFLVVSCPCALVISIPLSFFGGLGSASKCGILIKGSNYLEALAYAKIIVCDKTGTLTEGVFQVRKIEAIHGSQEELLKYAVMAENYSNHPISLSLREAYHKKIDAKEITETKEIPGKGVIAKILGKEVLIGNEKLMEDYRIAFTKSDEVGTILYIAIDRVFHGFILIADKIKEDSYLAIQELKKLGIQKVVMLTGDREEISKQIAQSLAIDTYYSELLPQDKVRLVEEMMNQQFTGKLIFVGDGINDAPVLSISDIGIAMGGIGSDAATSSADIVIMNDAPSKIASAIRIARKTMKIVKQNIVFVIAVKIFVLILSACGISTIWMAVFADVGVSILAILNALRILYMKR